MAQLAPIGNRAWGGPSGFWRWILAGMMGAGVAGEPPERDGAAGPGHGSANKVGWFCCPAHAFLMKAGAAGRKPSARR